MINEVAIENISSSIIIDGGAFDGDTVDMFIENMGKTSELKIHCYEAEDKNCNIIERKKEMGEWNPHKVILHKKALWERKDEIGFEGAGQSGHINKASGQKIRAEAIDDYDYEKVGFIKLDIEGAERNALLGAQNTIKKYRPILAICAYHLQDDILVLSNFIKSLDCNYKLFLRHYMLSAGDTILYGIPIVHL